MRPVGDGGCDLRTPSRSVAALGVVAARCIPLRVASEAVANAQGTPAGGHMTVLAGAAEATEDASGRPRSCWESASEIVAAAAAATTAGEGAQQRRWSATGGRSGARRRRRPPATAASGHRVPGRVPDGRRVDRPLPALGTAGRREPVRQGREGDRGPDQSLAVAVEAAGRDGPAPARSITKVEAAALAAVPATPAAVVGCDHGGHSTSHGGRGRSVGARRPTRREATATLAYERGRGDQGQGVPPAREVRRTRPPRRSTQPFSERAAVCTRP